MTLTTYYHVDRAKKLTEGQLLGLTNPVPGASNDSSRTRAMVGTYCWMFPGGTSEHGWRYLTRVKPHDNAVSGRVEMIVELVRRLCWPHKPSRLQSVFASRTLDEARAFMGKYPWHTGGPPAGHIWEVTATGIPHVGDMGLLRLGGSWLEAWTNAHLYWAGVGSDAPEWECLLPLPCTAVRIVDSA